MTLEEAKAILCSAADIPEYQLAGYNPTKVLTRAREIITHRRQEQMQRAGETREQFSEWYYQAMGMDRPETVAYHRAVTALDKVEEAMGIYDPGYAPDHGRSPTEEE